MRVEVLGFLGDHILCVFCFTSIASTLKKNANGTMTHQNKYDCNTNLCMQNPGSRSTGPSYSIQPQLHVVLSEAMRFHDDKMELPRLSH